MDQMQTKTQNELQEYQVFSYKSATDRLIEHR